MATQRRTTDLAERRRLAPRSRVAAYGANTLEQRFGSQPMLDYRAGRSSGICPIGVLEWTRPWWPFGKKRLNWRQVQMSALKRGDWTLLSTALARGEVLTPVQLQKAVFLMQELLPKDVQPEEPYVFIPHNYGPFSGDVYDDARDLAERGSVEISVPAAGGYVRYRATESGIQQGEVLTRKLSVETVRHAQAIVDWVRAQSFAGLVSAVYDRYPAYRVNSIFRG